MDQSAGTRSEGIEGALAALGGAAFLLPLGWETLPAALAVLPLAGLAGAVLGAWRPQYVGPIAFGFGLVAAVVALLVRGEFAASLLWLVLIPLLALPLGAGLALVGWAAPVQSLRPAACPAWANRPLGPDGGRLPLTSVLVDERDVAADVEIVELGGPVISPAIFGPRA